MGSYVFLIAQGLGALFLMDKQKVNPSVGDHLISRVEYSGLHYATLHYDNPLF